MQFCHTVASLESLLSYWGINYKTKMDRKISWRYIATASGEYLARFIEELFCKLELQLGWTFRPKAGITDTITLQKYFSSSPENCLIICFSSQSMTYRCCIKMSSLEIGPSFLWKENSDIWQQNRVIDRPQVHQT